MTSYIPCQPPKRSPWYFVSGGLVVAVLWAVAMFAVRSMISN